MPIEIRELLIRTEVIEKKQETKQEVDLNAVKEEVLQACIEKLEEMLENKNER